MKRKRGKNDYRSPCVHKLTGNLRIVRSFSEAGHFPFPSVRLIDGGSKGVGRDLYTNDPITGPNLKVSSIKMINLSEGTFKLDPVISYLVERDLPISLISQSVNCRRGERRSEEICLIMIRLGSVFLFLLFLSVLPPLISAYEETYNNFRHLCSSDRLQVFLFSSRILGQCDYSYLH